MSLDSNSVAGFVEEQSKENIKPTAIYTDLSKEVFPEVEALKKKFFQECDGLTSTVQDQQIVHVVKNILQTTTVMFTRIFICPFWQWYF
jgi:serine/threonine protein phosphatase PrpC